MTSDGLQTLSMPPLAQGSPRAEAYGTGYATNDPNSPMKGAAGPCLIFNEIKDGAISGTGRCVRTDRDGDTFAVLAEIDSFSAVGGTAGEWAIEGLTGKWVGATGSGRFAVESQSDVHYFMCFDGEFNLG